ncbi:MAG: hypothetical protein O7F71_17105, partial [Gammaproteobacteria bacterium]|nr:hypothetical protein [Gammaproteobacteria bacterium]
MATLVSKACLSLLLLLPAGVASADQNDARLDKLFLIIQQTDDAEVANDAEGKIWEIWIENDDKQTQERLAEGIAAMDENPRKALML